MRTVAEIADEGTTRKMTEVLTRLHALQRPAATMRCSVRQHDLLA
jgi:hypothetical protein